MLWYERLYLQDSIASRAESVKATKEALTRNAMRLVDWGYEPTRQVCEKSINDSLRQDQACSSAQKVKSKIGKKQNLEAISLLHPYFSRLRGNFYSLSDELYRYGPGLSCQIKALGHIYYQGNGTIYWLQLRKTGLLIPLHQEIVASVLAVSFLDLPDFEGFDLKIVDIGARSGEERTLRVIDTSELSLWSHNQLDEFFLPVHRAVMELRSEGFDPATTRRRQADESGSQGEFDFD